MRCSDAKSRSTTCWHKDLSDELKHSASVRSDTGGALSADDVDVVDDALRADLRASVVFPSTATWSDIKGSSNSHIGKDILQCGPMITRTGGQEVSADGGVDVGDVGAVLEEDRGVVGEEGDSSNDAGTPPAAGVAGTVVAVDGSCLVEADVRLLVEDSTKCDAV